MTLAVIPTSRRVEHARGFLALKLLNEAADELEAVEGADRLSDAVLRTRAELYTAAQHWDLLLAVSRELVRQQPNEIEAKLWVGTALLAMGRADEAMGMLREAEAVHGERNAALQLQLARCACACGEFSTARERMRKACRIDPDLKAAVLDDPALYAVWADLDTGA